MIRALSNKCYRKLRGAIAAAYVLTAVLPAFSAQELPGKENAFSAAQPDQEPAGSGTPPDQSAADTQAADTQTAAGDVQLTANTQAADTQAAETQTAAAEREKNALIRTELDIPIPDHELVRKYLAEFQSAFGKKWLAAVLETGTPYRAYVRRQLAVHNLPACLEYLPVVESEYKPSAKSRSGALGLWQFMENSIAPFLTKNEWIDERLDPWKSTDAAIQKLKDNYNWFGDWPLAIAAYNFGAGGLNRALKKTETKTFWHLAENDLISTQAALYVPKFLAVAELATNAAYYGLTLPDVTENDVPSWDEITVSKSIALSDLAEALGIGSETLSFLNPALIKGRTPPDEAYRVRVPAGMKVQAEQAVRTMIPLPKDFMYTVRKGDTLWGISRRFGTTVQELCALNNIDEKSILSIGKSLYVPIIE